MKLIYKVLNWFFGAIFLLTGLVGIFSEPLPSIPLIIVALLLLPPVRTFAYKKTQKEFPVKLRRMLIILLLITFVFLVTWKENAEEQRIKAEQLQEKVDQYYVNKDSIIGNINIRIENSEFEEAIHIIDQHEYAKDTALVKLKDKALNLFKIEKKEEKEKTLLARLKNVPVSEYKKNLDLYKELASLDSTNTLYQDKIDFYSERYENKLAAQRRAAERKEMIESQFDAWDGNHRNLEEYIKSVMNDPDSYKHVETYYSDQGDHLIVTTSFRGKNAFGGVVTNTVIAKVGLDGRIIAILKQF